MKFGVREICDVVLRAKSAQKIGNKQFYKHEPVIYFDSLKTSSVEGAATTVYAQGGRGNARLMAWEGERTLTFTMEDALISPEGFMILSGAGLIEAANDKPIIQHVSETIAKSDKQTEGAYLSDDTLTINVSKEVYANGKTAMGTDPDDNYIYVMLVNNGEIISEPYIGTVAKEADKVITVTATAEGNVFHANWDSVIVDYYTKRLGGAQQIEITADKFGGNYYLEAATLFRSTNGEDMPAEFIIPNCKIQSNFTFTMASSGDPSTFTFTMDAFPDYTRFDPTKKVLAAIQIITSEDTDDKEPARTKTPEGYTIA